MTARAALATERSRRLRQAMAERGLELLVVAGNAWRSDYLRYALDITTMEGQAIALLEASGAANVYVEHPVEARRIRAEHPTCTVHCHADPVAQALDRALATVAARGAQRVGLAPGHSVPTLLARSALGERLAQATAMMDDLMVRKSALESDAVARASALADEGYEVFRQAAVPGKREYELVGELEAWFRSRGCPENFMIMGSGGVEVRTMRPPGDRELQQGDLVTTELTPCLDGYYAQICRTLVIGGPTPQQLQAYAVYEEALAAGIRAVRPGATHGDVAKAQNDVFRRHGLAEYIGPQYTRVRGHGMGLFVDGPHVLEDVALVLEPDMTLVVHPNTYHPQAGYIVLGDTVRVTATGCELLSRTPRGLAQLSRGRK